MLYTGVLYAVVLCGVVLVSLLDGRGPAVASVVREKAYEVYLRARRPSEGMLSLSCP